MALRKYGRYECLHRIASGGMASVYLGRHLGAGGFERLVAIKVMHDHIADDPAFSAMFLDEARLAAQIRHPNVVPTLDVADDGRYIVMEYVEGASLQAILSARKKEQGGPIPLPVALRVFLDALAGLHAAHELNDTAGRSLNLVHRDVSPHNVLVGVDGMSRITDFGIAFAEARLTSTRSGQLKGKLPYMSPEQLEDGPVTRTTDVYAAGCVLWEMLCAKRLFRGSNEAAVACAVLAGPEQTVRALRPDIPASIDEACMRALERDGRRYPTALAFAEALEHAADEAGVRVARHREVGPVAQLEVMTYPAASTLTEGDTDPRPPELLQASPSHDPPSTRVSPSVRPLSGPATRPVVTPPTEAPTIAATTTLASETPPLVVAATTLVTPEAVPAENFDDGLPADVRAVIVAARAARDGADSTVTPVSAPTADFDDTQVVIPTHRGWSLPLVAVALALGVAATGLWLSTRGGETSSSIAPAARSASPPAASLPHSSPEVIASHSSAASPAPTTPPSVALSAVSPVSPVSPTPAPHPKPLPFVTHSTEPPKPSPPPPSGEYHPETP